jgi:hypothetical protein
MKSRLRYPAIAFLVLAAVMFVVLLTAEVAAMGPVDFRPMSFQPLVIAFTILVAVMALADAVGLFFDRAGACSAPWPWL